MAKASVLDRPNIHRNTRVGLKVPASRQNVIQPDDDSDRTSECSGLRGVRFTWVFWGNSEGVSVMHSSLAQDR